MTDSLSKGKGVMRARENARPSTSPSKESNEIENLLSQSPTRSMADSMSLGSQMGDDEKDQECDEAISLVADLHTSVFTLYHKCVLKLNGLLVILHNQPSCFDVENELQELCSKLQIWAGNHGAHRHHEDRLSLDYRLREAPELHQEVRDHFDDLLKTMEEAIAIGSTSQAEAEFQSDDASSSSSDSDGSLTNSQKAFIGLSIGPHPPKSTSKLQVTSQSIDNIIKSLYKFSITIQNPAHRDRTARATKIDVSFWHERDLRHVQDKFLKCSDTKLLQNLAQANTKRHQLFAYHKRHKDKIQYYQDTNVQEVLNTQSDHVAITGANLQGLQPPVASTVRTGKTKLTMTTVSMVNPSTRAFTPSISGRSQRTNITTDPLLASDEALKIPQPPGHLNDYSEPFICPYCFLTIDPTSKKVWELHVLDDLRPYVCTFADCVSAPFLYERFSEWSAHELGTHRREWFCNFCKTLCHTKEEFAAHLQLEHQHLVADKTQLDPLISLCERISTRDEDCPLCDSFTGKPREVLSHLAQHLRQLALYTLPRVPNGDADESEGGTNIANVHDSNAAISENTQKELLQMSIEEVEESFSAFTRPNSPSLNLPDLDDPVDWKEHQKPLLLSLSENDKKKYQKMVESFSRQILTSREDVQATILPTVAPAGLVTHGPAHPFFKSICLISARYAVLLSAVEHYKHGFEYLVKWKRFKTDFIGFLDSLEKEAFLYGTMVDHLGLISGCLDLNKDFFQDVRRLDHLSSEEFFGLQTIISSYEISLGVIENIVRAIVAILNSLMDLLSLDEDGIIQWADESFKKWDSQMKRVQLRFSKKGNSRMISLESHNRRLKELIGETSNQQSPAELRQLQSFAQTRKNTAGLYAMLQRSWKCSCQASHILMLQLNISHRVGKDWSSPFCLCITSSTKDGTTNIYNLLIAHHKAIPFSVVEVQSVCSVLRPGTDTMLGYIGNESDGYYILRLSFEHHTPSTSSDITHVGLSELLLPSAGDIRLSRRQRLQMGSVFLRSLLQLSPTQFLEGHLKKERIFFLKTGSSLDINNPYLSFSHITDFNTNRGGVTDELSVRNSLRNMGILLLELLFGQTIESQELRKPYLGPNGEAVEYTDYMTACDWAKFVDEEILGLGPVIRKLIFCSFDTKLDWDNENFIRDLYISVVQPWEEKLGMMTGKAVQKDA